MVTGQGAKRTSDDGSCNDSRYCISLKSGFSCNTTPKCRCKNCQNPTGERVHIKTSWKLQNNLPKHQRKLRIAGSDDQCYAWEGLEQKYSRWTDRETLALFIIKRYFSEKMMKSWTWNTSKHVSFGTTRADMATNIWKNFKHWRKYFKLTFRWPKKCHLKWAIGFTTTYWWHFLVGYTEMTKKCHLK